MYVQCLACLRYMHHLGLAITCCDQNNKALTMYSDVLQALRNTESTFTKYSTLSVESAYHLCISTFIVIVYNVNIMIHNVWFADGFLV